MSPMIEDSIDRSQSNSSDRLEVCEPRVSGRVKPMATSEVTDAEDGTAIDADVGDTILLAVLDDPTTGYRWELEPVTGVSIVLDVAGYEPSSGEAGSGGVATWLLSVAAAGTTAIALKRWRPWEGDASILNRFTVTVDVRLD